MKFIRPRALLIALLGLPLVALSAPVAPLPFGIFCGFGGGPGTGFAICAEAEGHGGGGAGGSFFAAPVPPLPARATSVGPVAVAVGGGGSGALTASASAFGDYGLLRATAVATAPNIPPDNESLFQSVGQAGASFKDVGKIDSLSLVNGTPAHAKATLDIGGSFGGFGEARYHLVIGNPLGGPLLVNFEGAILAGRPSVHQEFDLTGLQVGVDYFVSMELIAEANAFVQGGASRTLDFADVGNTAHFHLDFLTDGVRFKASSGHDYSSPIPIPAAFPLLLSALGALSIQRRNGSSRRDRLRL